MKQPTEALLRVDSISKSFAGIQALQQVSLDLYPGKVTAILGENGAGKSTLMKIISGVYADYQGRLFYAGEPVTFTDPKSAQDRGISMIHQELNLIPQLCIRENVFLGREPRTSLGFLDVKMMREQCQALLERVGLALDPDTPVEQLKVGQQQLVEIAKALSLDSQVLIMDEPTSAISENEVAVLFRIIRTLKKEGKAIAYISHKLDELFEIADNYVVLRDGKLIETGALKDTSSDALIRKMVGRELQLHRNDRSSVSSDCLLQVRDLALTDPNREQRYLLKAIDFDLFKGEVLGLFGLMGAGRTELLEALFGLRPGQVEGSIALGGRKGPFRRPKEAMQAGLGLVPEDRKQEGLVLGMDIAQNTSLAVLDELVSGGWIQEGKEAQLAEKYRRELQIKTTGIRQRVENLSGGNQQKVVLAKWLATKPKVLLLDEPTRGIDIPAKNEIYKLIRNLATEGLGLLVVSSELPEILAVADRVLVLSEGRLTATIPIDESTSEDRILAAAIPKKHPSP